MIYNHNYSSNLYLLFRMKKNLVKGFISFFYGFYVGSVFLYDNSSNSTILICF